MAVLFLVKSFVKDNVSSIVVLISTIVFMIIGYKLNVIIQQSNNKSCSESNTIIEGNKQVDNYACECNLNKNTNKSQLEISENNNDIKYKDIIDSNLLNKECLSDIHMLLTYELLDLLIYGFILLNNNYILNGISPDIISLIYLYYNNNYLYTQIFVIKGSHKGRNPLLNKIECINLNYKISYNINIYNINDTDENENDTCIQQLSTIDRDWDTEENGICFVPNIKPYKLIPKYILNKINIIYNKYHMNNNEIYFNNGSRYNAIFKCAGMTALGSNLSLNSNASMIIFKEDSFKKFDKNTSEFIGEYNDSIIAFEIDLPDLPRSQTYCAQTVYSSSHGLITNCRDNAFVLNINKWKNNEMKWNKLPSMLNQRNWASSLCVCSDSDNKLFICSGDGVTNKSCEIFSFLDNKWYNMCQMNNSFLMQSGIYYDSIGNNKIYVGGGYKTENQITYYSMYKNLWYDLPDTKYKHSEYPSIWCNKFQLNNILYINGNTRNDLNVIEYIDLRTNEWNLCSNMYQINQFIETPQLFKHNNGEKLSNHHRNNSQHHPMQIRRTFV
eukprot:541503_1